MIKCDICGKQIDKSVYSDANLCSSECFHKAYWLERVKNVKSPTQLVIRGDMYQIAREDDASDFRGFGGFPHYIKFFDGRVVKTTNLWANGKVPEEYRDKLPDNAEFISQDEYEKLKEKQNV